VQMREAPADELLDVTLEPALVEGHALHHGAHVMSPRGSCFLIEKRAARGGILRGRQHAVDPGREAESVAAWRNARREPVQLPVDLAGRRCAGGEKKLLHELEAAAGRA